MKAFAKRMVVDHTGVNQSAVALVEKLKVTPEDNPTSQSLKTGGDTNIQSLKALKGRNSITRISTTKLPITRR